jgi:hypothetical protein
MTGTEAQGGEEFRAGNEIERRYPKRVLHITFPDRFAAESVTVVAQITGLAADPQVRVVIAGQAVPGVLAAAQQIRSTRPDVLIGVVTPHESPDSIAAVADLVLETDVVARGAEIVAGAHRMGARSLVYYSCPRHMDQPRLVRQRDVMRAACEQSHMAFSARATPDPAVSGGVQDAREFILADVPKQLDSLGATTAFYSADDALQEPLIRALLTARSGYLVEQAIPSPTLGYPEALDWRIPEAMADSGAFVNAAIESLVTVKGMHGHFGSWAASVDGVALRATANLLADAVDRKADPRDSATVLRYLEAEARSRVTIRRGSPAGSHWYVSLDRVVY